MFDEFEDYEPDYEQYERDLAEENAKDYFIPPLGSIVSVSFSKNLFVVIRTDYTTNYTEKDKISKYPVVITGVEYGKTNPKFQESFHVAKITEISPPSDDDLSMINKIIQSQIPEVGKTAIVHNSSLCSDGFHVKKYKIVKVIKRKGCEDLLKLKPTKHFNGKLETLSLGHCYLS